MILFGLKLCTHINCHKADKLNQYQKYIITNVQKQLHKK
jgi:hypothetical protein